MSRVARGWTSADAAGLPILPGLVRYDEVVEQKKIELAFKNLRATGIKSFAFFIYGYPGETPKSMEQTTADLAWRMPVRMAAPTPRFVSCRRSRVWGQV